MVKRMPLVFLCTSRRLFPCSKREAVPPRAPKPQFHENGKG